MIAMLRQLAGDDVAMPQLKEGIILHKLLWVVKFQEILVTCWMTSNPSPEANNPSASLKHGGSVWWSMKDLIELNSVWLNFDYGNM